MALATIKMFSSKSPILNLHGETRDTIKYLLDGFILDNIKLKVLYVGVIHGRSSDILKNKVHELLKQSKYVDSYKVDIFNPGMTIVKLKISQ